MSKRATFLHKCMGTLEIRIHNVLQKWLLWYKHFWSSCLWIAFRIRIIMVINVIHCSQDNVHLPAASLLFHFLAPPIHSFCPSPGFTPSLLPWCWSQTGGVCKGWGWVRGAGMVETDQGCPGRDKEAKVEHVGKADPRSGNNSTMQTVCSQSHWLGRFCEVSVNISVLICEMSGLRG